MMMLCHNDNNNNNNDNNNDNDNNDHNKKNGKNNVIMVHNRLNVFFLSSILVGY